MTKRLQLLLKSRATTRLPFGAFSYSGSSPYCVTVDVDSLDDRQVTIRERDSMAQRRVPIAKLTATLLQDPA